MKRFRPKGNLLDRRRGAAQGLPELGIEHVLSAREPHDLDLNRSWRNGFGAPDPAAGIAPFYEFGAHVPRLRVVQDPENSPCAPPRGECKRNAGASETRHGA